MPHEVFISHSAAGKLTAYAICSELESIGIRCWIPPRDLNIGNAWEQIANAVSCCRVMIVVLSDYASRTERVEQQLQIAFNFGVTVIPFRTESKPIVGEPIPPLGSVHWLDTVTPEMSQRLRSLCDSVQGLLLRQKAEALPARTLATGQEDAPQLRIESLTDLPESKVKEEKVQLTANEYVAESSVSNSEKNSLPVFEAVEKGEPADKRPASRKLAKVSRWRPVKALLLTLLPFAIIFGVGLWYTKKKHKVRPAKPVAAATTPNTPIAPIAPPVAVKAEHQDRLSASDPGWGAPDANWTVADDKLRVAPLLNTSAVIINRARAFTDADITAEIMMSQGEALDQLGGLVFWAKDYNDCYALVVSADGKFAIGRNLVGRWINPIAKTANAAIKTGIEQTNKLRVRTEGNLFTAFINDTQVATLAGEPPQGSSFIGLYGESAESTQNVWEFTNVTVTSVPSQK
jgi:hypothetical protein